MIMNSIKEFFSNPLKWMSTGTPIADGGDGGKGKMRYMKATVAGGISGAIEICITYPADYVKTHLQLENKGASRPYTIAGDVVKKTIDKYGVFGLYRGCSILLYGIIPKLVTRFGAYEALKSMLTGKYGPELSPHFLILSGLGAGIIEAILVVTPLETVKVKIINDRRSEKSRFKGIVHCIRVILKEEGVGGIYQGVLPTVLKQGSNAAIRFYVTDSLKAMYCSGKLEITVPKTTAALMGVFVGTLGTFGNTPIDFVKTRMQAKKYKGTVDCIMKTYKEEGIYAFYKGTSPRQIRMCMDCAIILVVYDSFMEFFNRVWP